ncbi:MAG: hypothetical protein AAFP02_10090 [Bacteroidota bacterium]
MERFERFRAELQVLCPFTIRYKEEAWEMQILQALIGWFCPGFLSRFTTVIGRTIYFPNRAYIERNPEAAMRILAHEAVHLSDAAKISWPLFAVAYLFPQILAVGVFSFPWLGPWALLFLLFLLPIPSPTRARYESRAYAIDLLTHHPDVHHQILAHATAQFEGWNYYKMYPFPEAAAEQIEYWAKNIESGEEQALLNILLVYEWVVETEV